VGVFLAFGTPNLYSIFVGGQPLAPVAPSIIITFEMTMLGMLISTFVGVFLDSHFPSYSPKEYIPEISDGNIAVLFTCPLESQEEIISALKASGVQKIEPAEAQPL
jgi:hypothetical protein